MGLFTIRSSGNALVLEGRGTTYFENVVALAYLLSGVYRIPRDKAKIDEIPGFILSYSYDARKQEAKVSAIMSISSCLNVAECENVPNQTIIVSTRIRFDYDKKCNVPTRASRTDLTNLRSAYSYMIKAICETICEGKTITYEEMKKLVEQKLSFRELPARFIVGIQK